LRESYLQPLGSRRASGRRAPARRVASEQARGAVEKDFQGAAEGVLSDGQILKPSTGPSRECQGPCSLPALIRARIGSRSRRSIVSSPREGPTWCVVSFEWDSSELERARLSASLSCRSSSSAKVRIAGYFRFPVNTLHLLPDQVAIAVKRRRHSTALWLVLGLGRGGGEVLGARSALRLAFVAHRFLLEHPVKREKDVRTEKGAKQEQAAAVPRVDN